MAIFFQFYFIAEMTREQVLDAVLDILGYEGEVDYVYHDGTYQSISAHIEDLDLLLAVDWLSDNNLTIYDHIVERFNFMPFLSLGMRATDPDGFEIWQQVVQIVTGFLAQTYDDCVLTVDDEPVALRKNGRLALRAVEWTADELRFIAGDFDHVLDIDVWLVENEGD